MTITVDAKTRELFPASIRRKAGIKIGDEFEVNVSGKVITMLPKAWIADDDEYTPEQRRIIDAQLDEAEKGPFYGPFDNVAAMIAHMKGELQKRASAKKLKRTR